MFSSIPLAVEFILAMARQHWEIRLDICMCIFTRAGKESNTGAYKTLSSKKWHFHDHTTEGSLSCSNAQTEHMNRYRWQHSEPIKPSRNKHTAKPNLSRHITVIKVHFWLQSEHYLHCTSCNLSTRLLEHDCEQTMFKYQLLGKMDAIHCKMQQHKSNEQAIDIFDVLFVLVNLCTLPR